MRKEIVLLVGLILPQFADAATCDPQFVVTENTRHGWKQVIAWPKSNKEGGRAFLVEDRDAAVSFACELVRWGLGGSETQQRLGLTCKANQNGAFMILLPFFADSSNAILFRDTTVFLGNSEPGGVDRFVGKISCTP